MKNVWLGYEKDRPREMQRVWRTFSDSNNSGFFVWDVMEVIGTPEQIKETVDDWPSLYTSCIDGSYVYIQCSHFWDKERALEFLNNDTEYGQEVIIISNARQEASICKNCGLKGNLPCGCNED